MAQLCESAVRWSDRSAGWDYNGPTDRRLRRPRLDLGGYQPTAVAIIREFLQ